MTGPGAPDKTGIDPGGTMTDSDLDVLVAGTGVMGRGIAASFAAAGLRTAMLSRDPARAAAPADGVPVIGALPDRPPHLIVESVLERTDVKLALFERIERAYGGRPAIGSNSSTLPLQELADALRHPERFCGMHYMQPADVMPMVELARVAQTGDDAFDLAAELLRRAGKIVLPLTRPLPGLLINRLQHAFLHEAYAMIDAGVVTAREVDLVCKHVLGPRMSVTGMIEQKDISGLDTHALSQAELIPRLHHGAEPCDAPQRRARAGRHGVKSGRGFYDWRSMDAAAYCASASALVREVMALLDARRPAPPPLADD